MTHSLSPVLWGESAKKFVVLGNMSTVLSLDCVNGFIFDWLLQINRSLRESAETKINNDIQESDNFKPCHSEPISVSILSSDPLEVSIKGSITYKCGKMLASFNGSSDGSTLNYVFAEESRGGCYFWPNFPLETDR